MTTLICLRYNPSRFNQIFIDLKMCFEYSGPIIDKDNRNIVVRIFKFEKHEKL